MNSWDFMIETEEESFEIEKVLAVNITVNCVTPTQHTHTQKWIKEQHTTLKKLGSAGIFLQWPVCRSKTIACSLHLFLLFFHLSFNLSGEKRAKPWVFLLTDTSASRASLVRSRYWLFHDCGMCEIS